MCLDYLVGTATVIIGVMALAVRTTLWRACVRPFLYAGLVPRWCYVKQYLPCLLASGVTIWISYQAIRHGNLSPMAGYALMMGALLVGGLAMVCALFKRIYFYQRRCHLAVYRILRQNRALPWIPGLLLIVYGFSLLLCGTR